MEEFPGIVNDTIMALSRKKKHAGNDRAERYSHLSAINVALQQLKKLICTNVALGAELKDCLYSRNTFTSLGKLLITQDYDDYIREMTRRSLDWRNPLGQDTYECFKYIYTMERNMLEAARDNGGFNTSQPSLPPATTGVIPPKGKSKGVFATFDNSDSESDGDEITGAHTAARHSE